MYGGIDEGFPAEEFEFGEGEGEVSKPWGGAKRRHNKGPCCLCCFKRRWVCVTTVLAVVIVLLVTAMVVLRYAFLPGFIANEIKKRDLVFFGVNLTNPTSNTLVMRGSSALNPPLPVNLDLFMSSPAIRVQYYSTQTLTYQTAGHFTVPPSTKIHPNGTLNIESVFTITDQAAFNDMANTMFKTEFLLWEVDGTIDVTAVVAGVDMSIDNVVFQKSISLPGCGGFASSFVQSMDIYDAGPEGVMGRIIMVIDNPSVVTMDPMGNLSVSVMYMDPVYGNTVIGPPSVIVNATLGPGRNVLLGEGIITGGNMTILQHLFDNYLANQPSMLLAFNGSSTIPLYNGAVQNMNITALLPGYEGQIILEAVSYMNITYMLELFKQTKHIMLPAKLLVSNPFNVDLTMFAVDGVVYYKDLKTQNDTAVGYLRIVAGEGPNITVGANSTQLSPEVAIVVAPETFGAFEDVVYAFLYELKYNATYVDFKANISIRIGNSDLAPMVYYEQYNVTLTDIPPEEFYGADFDPAGGWLDSSWEGR